MLKCITIPQGIHYVHNIISNAKIYYKLNDLLINISSSTTNVQHDLIIIAIENNNQKRHFLSLTFDQLSTLIHELEPSKCTLYEILSLKNYCKLYFDFDIYVEKCSELNIEQSLSILQNLFHYILINLTNQFTYTSTLINNHFLVLSASTQKKFSFHLIYTNTSIRFESQQIILKFIISVLQYCSSFILTHACLQHYINIIDKNNINNFNNCHTYLQTILSHTNFCHCIIPGTNITCNNFQKLLFKQSDGSYQWVIDLHVYSNNQQFRLFKSTKFGKNNHLLLTPNFPFNQQNHQYDGLINNNVNYDHILIHSLISYREKNKNFLIISNEENKWLLFDQNQNKTINLNTSLYFTSLIQSFKSTSTNNNILTKAIKTTIDPQLSNQHKFFTDFVLELITKEYNTHGYIQSCQQGKQNHSLFFYNIGGPFRFCERLQRHHKSNQTCIIIDTLTLKYQIKCKDPDCHNFKPPWKQISDLN